MNDARCALPAGWQDQTVHIFAAGGGGGAPPEFSVVIHRDVPAAGEDLAAYVVRQRANLLATLPGLQVLREGTLTLGGSHAQDAEFRWTGEPGLLRQRQVYLLRQGRVLTITGTAPERLWAKHVAQFDALLASWRFQITLIDPRASPGVAPAD
ncbi:MAG TPA: DcrB-related protein [Gemmatirosa sp.]